MHKYQKKNASEYPNNDIKIPFQKLQKFQKNMCSRD